MKVSPKILNKTNYNFSDYFQAKRIDHLKLLLFCRYTASLKILISKVQDF